ncbi:MAG: hydroxyethylthiazole kinase [Lachnospiraceae bacterium]|nr:hydroxyethylthiazole kinase [Lachnospiraceae bacterium]
MFKECFDKVRNQSPLIHNITNYVTINDVANILLACGASPIMADEAVEVEEITSICSGLNINIGKLNRHMIPAMLLAGKKACELGHAVVLDPVGVGASRLRLETADFLMKEIRFSAIRGNISEIKTLMYGSGRSKGVDAAAADALSGEDVEAMAAALKEYARETGCIIAATGSVDLVCDSRTCYVIRNGRPEMEKVTGTGCQLSGLMTAFLAANPGNYLEAAAAAVAAMGLAGENGWSYMQPGDGSAAYRNRIIDAIYNMDGTILEQGARFEIIC